MMMLFLFLPSLNLIPIIRAFFLDNNGKAQRHEYALSLPLEVQEMLLALESAFINQGLDASEIIDLLEKYQLSPFTDEIREIQKEYYIKVNNLTEELPYVEDHEDLIKAHNPSYAFLTNEESFPKELETVLRYKNREAIRERVKKLEQERLASEIEDNDNISAIGEGEFVPAASYSYERSEPSLKRRRSIWPYIAGAASLALFLIWQPFHKNNSSLFNEYILINEQIALSESNATDGGTRSTLDETLNDLSEIEKSKMTDAYLLYKNKNYKAASQEFAELGVSSEKGSQFLIFMAISQLHTNELDKARENLEGVLSKKDSIHYDDALFYLSLYNLKVNNRQKAKEILSKLEGRPNKYQDEARNILKKIRWF